MTDPLVVLAIAAIFSLGLFRLIELLVMAVVGLIRLARRPVTHYWHPRAPSPADEEVPF